MSTRLVRFIAVATLLGHVACGMPDGSRREPVDMYEDYVSTLHETQILGHWSEPSQSSDWEFTRGGQYRVGGEPRGVWLINGSVLEVLPDGQPATGMMFLLTKSGDQLQLTWSGEGLDPASFILKRAR